jgi:hypothetical protein
LPGRRLSEQSNASWATRSIKASTGPGRPVHACVLAQRNAPQIRVFADLVSANSRLIGHEPTRAGRPSTSGTAHAQLSGKSAAGGKERDARVAGTSLRLHGHFGLGTLYHRTDKREQALEHLSTATTMYREMGMTYWLEKAEAEMTELGG